MTSEAKVITLWAWIIRAKRHASLSRIADLSFLVSAPADLPHCPAPGLQTVPESRLANPLPAAGVARTRARGALFRDGFLVGRDDDHQAEHDGKGHRQNDRRHPT